MASHTEEWDNFTADAARKRSLAAIENKYPLSELSYDFLELIQWHINNAADKCQGHICVTNQGIGSNIESLTASADFRKFIKAPVPGLIYGNGSDIEWVHPDFFDRVHWVLVARGFLVEIKSYVITISWIK